MVWCGDSEVEHALAHGSHSEGNSRATSPSPVLSPNEDGAMSPTMVLPPLAHPPTATKTLSTSWSWGWGKALLPCLDFPLHQECTTSNLCAHTACHFACPSRQHFADRRGTMWARLQTRGVMPRISGCAAHLLLLNQGWCIIRRVDSWTNNMNTCTY